MAFDYSKLPREFPRRFVPTGMKFTWEELKKIFDELEARKVGSPMELEQWLRDEAELDAVIYEQRTLLYINSSRQTDNPEYQRAYKHFIDELEPKIKLASFELLKKYASSPFRDGLSLEVYHMTDRKRNNAVSIFRAGNVELEKRDAGLAQVYQQTLGAMTVNFRGEELTLQQMAKFQEETDRDVRKEAWRLAEERALKDAETLDLLYDEMVKLRDVAARNAGFDNFRDYIFPKKNRFDYTPDDCIRFHDAVQENFVPLSREIDRERLQKLGVERLTPWDIRVDPEGRPPLSPFTSAETLVAGCAKVVARVDPDLSNYFARMVDLRLLDLESRKGKAPGGYQEDLAELKLPFIFMNAARRDTDVRTLLHESGHSFHTFLMRDSGLPFFNSGPNLPTEFAEVASTSMELIGGEHLVGSFYSEEDARRSNKAEVVSMVKLFTWVATIDSFQHWVYTHPQHTYEERRRAWVGAFERFGGLETYEGYERQLGYRWQRQLHLFEVPFYYIEYGIATLGALGIWLQYRKEPREAIKAYKQALSLGGSRPLPYLFRTAGLEWNFGPSALHAYANDLRALLREYSP